MVVPQEFPVRVEENPIMSAAAGDPDGKCRGLETATRLPRLHFPVARVIPDQEAHVSSGENAELRTGLKARWGIQQKSRLRRWRYYRNTRYLLKFNRRTSAFRKI